MIKHCFFSKSNVDICFERLGGVQAIIPNNIDTTSVLQQILYV